MRPFRYFFFFLSWTAAPFPFSAFPFRHIKGKIGAFPKIKGKKEEGGKKNAASVHINVLCIIIMV